MANSSVLNKKIKEMADLIKGPNRELPNDPLERIAATLEKMEVVLEFIALITMQNANIDSVNYPPDPNQESFEF